MDKGKHYDCLRQAWIYEKKFICGIADDIKNKKEVDADSAATLVKMLQEKVDVIRSLENSMRTTYCELENRNRYHYYYLESCSALDCSPSAEILRRIKCDSALLKLNRIANPPKLSEEAGQTQSVAELDGIKKTLQELNEKMEICMTSVMKGSPQVAVKAKDASDDEIMDLLHEVVGKMEILATEQETMKKKLQDLIEKTGAGTVSAAQKKPVVDEEKVDYVRMRLITDLLQGLVSNSDKKEEEGTMVNMKSLTEVKVKKLLEELKTIQTADSNDVEQKEDNKDGEV